MRDSNTLPTVDYLSVAAPAYNEEAGITAIVMSWHNYLKNHPHLRGFEIIICNDGSKDGTGNLLDVLNAQYPEIKPIHSAVNQGAAAALATAIKSTSHPWVLLLDSDGQYDISSLESMIASLQTFNSLAVTGVRTKKYATALAKFGSWSSGKLCNLFHGTHYTDFNCALKLVEGEVLRALPLEAKGLNYSTEITSRLIESGIVMTEVKVEPNPRRTGRSSATTKAIFHRILFVAFIGIRQYLLRQGVITIRRL